MTNNANHTGPNWTGQSYRTVRDAFPQYPGSDYVEPNWQSKAADVVVLVAVVAVFGAMCVLGGVFYGAL